MGGTGRLGRRKYTIDTVYSEHAKLLGRVGLFAASLTVAFQAPLSIGFFRQEYWSGLPCPPPGDLPDPELKPSSPALADRFLTTRATFEVEHLLIHKIVPKVLGYKEKGKQDLWQI